MLLTLRARLTDLSAGWQDDQDVSPGRKALDGGGTAASMYGELLWSTVKVVEPGVLAVCVICPSGATAAVVAATAAARTVFDLVRRGKPKLPGCSAPQAAIVILSIHPSFPAPAQPLRHRREPRVSRWFCSDASASDVTV